MNRRLLLASSLAGVLAFSRMGLAQSRIEPTVVPAPATPAATPSSDIPPYRGDLVKIWIEPWEVEGKVITFKGVIMQRDVAPEGSAIAVGADGENFRSLLHLHVPLGDGSANDLFVASNSDLSNVAERKTIEVTGIYGGLHGPGWTQPLVIASDIQPAS